ncbi:MAG: hypothetical protein V3T84_06580 [Phycisphaerales bacterium]
MLRWTSGRKRCGETLDGVDQISKREAKARQRAKQSAFDSGTESPNRPDRMTLRQLIAYYPDRRRQFGKGRGHLRKAQKLSEATIDSHLMTLRYMVQFFGGDQAIDRISLSGADDFIDALEAGKLSAARAKLRRKYEVGPQTIRRHIRNSKAVFTWALLFELVQANPFAMFEGKPLATEPNHYVTMSEFHKLYRAAPSQGWRMLFALCRLAGLRLDAARTLPWSGHATDSDGERHWIGIDWDRHRICIVGNSKVTKKNREVPIRPLLYRLLRTAFDSSEARFQHPRVGECGSITGLSPNNLTRIGQRAARHGGMEPWPKLYQAMRASCENDLKMRGVAEATYAAWMGHSPTVSRKHYTAPTDQEFAAVARVA